MGKGLFYQCHITPGYECVAISDIIIGRACSCAEWLAYDYRIVENENQINDAINAGKLAVCADGNLAATCDGADVFIETSNSIIPAARFSINAIKSGKHLILMNAEIDLIFGPYLMDLAHQHNVVYSSCDGDQHGVIKHIVDEIKLWGFELVMAGNMKGFLDRYSNPEKIIPEADKRNLDYKMATAYTDGTKLNIEMALLCNALNLETLKPGMTGPIVQHVKDVLDVFDFKKIRGQSRPVVDYILNSQPDGGVFVVGWSENEYQRAMMKYYKMGDGPFYVFYRPYHLCHVEALGEITKTVKQNTGLLQPKFGFQGNVFSYAKKELHAGELLDGIGGFALYGMLENVFDKTVNTGLPICLAEGVKLKRKILKDEKILMEDIEIPENRLDFDLFFQSMKLSEKQWKKN